MKKFVAFIFCAIALSSSAQHFTFRNVGIVSFSKNTTPPSAPEEIYIPGHNQTAVTDMPLTWSASPAASSYNIYRSTTSGSGYSLLHSGTVGTSYTDTTASGCVGYFYVVTAVNSGGESSYSPQTNGTNIAKSSSLVATVNTAPTVDTPGSPGASVAYDCAGGYSGEATIDYEIYAKVGGFWSAVAAGTGVFDDGTSGPYNVNISWSSVASATEYRVYRQVNGDGFNDYYSTSDTTVTDDGGASAIGGSSPPTPVGDGLPYSVTLTWSAPPGCNVITSIRRSESSGGPYDELDTVSAATTSYIDVPGVSSTYYYVIVFNTSVHQSEFSNEQTAVY